ncbi:hypothetical protein [Curtobacterium sp. MCSS17_015]|uniref:hypothetical protein n=1 Tax=Curtobacterium sp. MCSS17_015 TaxID=2175666 RepID=UPI000DAA43DA|nr:hypothetical protein [Curtobacterium sp. MCSS17_015]WIB25412.1 hypothetical protein DEJ18_10115 [Curtobacterium sp. MCSS17_015]
MTDTTTKYENARDALRQAPDLIEHMVALIPIKTKPGADDTVRSKRVEPPLPFNEGAFSDANELYGRIVHWALFWGNALKVQSPGPAKQAWRTRAGSVVGLPLGSEPHQARYDVSIMSRWLLIHLDEIFRRQPDDVAYFTTELNEIHQAAARYPVNATPHWSNLSCRVGGCGGRVALYPFTKVKTWTEKGRQVFLPPEGARVLCVECSDQWTQAEYSDEIERRLLAVKEQQKADRVQARLAKKYATPSVLPKFLGTVAGKVRHPKPE